MLLSLQGWLNVLRTSDVYERVIESARTSTSRGRLGCWPLLLLLLLALHAMRRLQASTR